MALLSSSGTFTILQSLARVVFVGNCSSIFVEKSIATSRYAGKMIELKKAHVQPNHKNSILTKKLKKGVREGLEKLMIKFAWPNHKRVQVWHTLFTGVHN